MASRIEIADHITLQNITSLHDALCDAFAQPEAIEINAERFTGGDLAVVQLIVAARAEALACNRSLTLSAPANPQLASLLERAGMAPNTPADTQFWFHGESGS
jgi:STAS domain